MRGNDEIDNLIAHTKHLRHIESLGYGVEENLDEPINPPAQNLAQPIYFVLRHPGLKLQNQLL